jgi:hypothetical protein
VHSIRTSFVLLSRQADSYYLVPAGSEDGVVGADLLTLMLSMMLWNISYTPTAIFAEV